MNKDKIVFCRVAWMKYYQGKTDEDTPSSGGSYVKEYQDGHESNNFLPYNHHCYGWTMRSSINLDAIAGETIQSDKLEDVTVVWVARNPAGRSYIVGWYEHADAYRFAEVLPSPTREDNELQEYFFDAKETDCVLIPEAARSFEIPRATKYNRGQGMGQSNTWYAAAEAAAPIRQQVLDYIRQYSGERELFFFSEDDLKRSAKDDGQSPEVLLKLARETPDPYEALQYANLLLEKDSSAEAYQLRADYLIALCCFTEAEETFRRLLYEYKDDVNGLDGLMYVESLQFKDFFAIEHGKRLLQLLDDGEFKYGVFHNLMLLFSRNGDRESRVALLKSHRALAQEYNPDELKAYEEELLHH